MNINPLATAFAGAQPANASTGQPSTSSAAAAEAPKAAEKTEFKLTLQKFDTASKAKIIREIKLILPQLNLVEVSSTHKAASFSLLLIFLG